MWKITYLVWFLTIFFAGSGLLYLIIPVETFINEAGELVYYAYGYNEPGGVFPLISYDITLFSEHFIAFYVHVTFGPISLITGLINMYGTIRKRKPNIHRLAGKVYLITQFISLPAGMYLGMHEFAGIVAVYGFLGMGGSTLISSAMAYYYICKRNYELHREWMIRSYCIMWSSVVLFRIALMYWIPFEIYRIGGTIENDFRDLFIVCIFLSWSLPILVADIYISLTKPKLKKKTI